MTASTPPDAPATRAEAGTSAGPADPVEAIRAISSAGNRPTAPQPQAEGPPATVAPSAPADRAGIEAAQPPLMPPSQLPLAVADLIGLRFSLLQLRLAGYGLLGAWGTEMVNLISASDLLEIGPRLHYISEFLNLTPVLLVGLALVGFQGGLRRRPAERLVLPLLFALLPCLTALLLLLAPISIANAVTLAAQQQRLETVRLRGFESQLDRVGTLIRQEKRLDQLIQRLQAIPGLSVEAPSGLSLAETRREALVSIKAERQRLRQQVQRSSSSSREALQRRSLLNAGQALVMGLVVWGCHHMAVNEMEQAIPYLQWALTVPDDEAQHATVLRELLEFQRRCVALSPLALLQLASRLLQQQPGDQGQASDDPETLIYDPANSHLYPLEPQAPARGRSWLIGIDLSGWWPGRRQATAPAPDDAAAGDPTTDGQAYSYSAFEPPAPPAPNAATIRRQRERASLEWQRMGEALDPSQQALQADQQPELPFQRARRRRRLQEQERARQALRSFGDYLRLSHGEAPEEILAEPAPPPGAADRPGWQRSLTAPGRWLRRALERLP